MAMSYVAKFIAVDVIRPSICFNIVLVRLPLNFFDLGEEHKTQPEMLPLVGKGTPSTYVGSLTLFIESPVCSTRIQMY